MAEVFLAVCGFALVIMLFCIVFLLSKKQDMYNEMHALERQNEILQSRLAAQPKPGAELLAAQDEVILLRREIADLKEENETLKANVEYWKRAAGKLPSWPTELTEHPLHDFKE